MIETKTRKPLAYNIALASIQSEQRVLFMRQKWLQTHQKVVNAIYKRFAKAPEGLITYQPSITVSGWYDGVTCTFSMSVLDLIGFKCEKLASLLDLFVDADEMSTQDWPSSLSRDYRFTFKAIESDPSPLAAGGGFYRSVNHTIVVNICAYVKEESPTCRRVLKGVKMISTEQKIYEMVCSDEVTEAPIVATAAEPD